MGITEKEVKGSEYQQKICNLLGRTVTKAEALKALKLHEAGDGGNTVGWKFDKLVNDIFICTSHQHTALGDNIIDLGRLANENPDLKWCFPELYKYYNKVDQSKELK